VGRDQELARVRELLEAVRGGLTGALVVEGEAGIGKTSLPAAADELADGFTCLWARGVESEAALGHAALLELITPVRDRLADVPEVQAEALAVALGWGADRGARGPLPGRRRHPVAAGRRCRVDAAAGAGRRPALGRPGVGGGAAVRPSDRLDDHRDDQEASDRNRMACRIRR
jgi:CTP:molybdopterin cytidylyltransferase MocA